MRLLDLFSGAGGAAMGYHRAGFTVTGIDIVPQKRYPFEHWVTDVTTLDVDDLDGFDVVHASPPCEFYSRTHSRCASRYETCPHPDLIEPVRELLQEWGGPYVIENVEGAPLKNPGMLCGGALALGIPGAALRRHRMFESNLWWMSPGCGCGSGTKIGVYGKGGAASHGRQATKAEKSAALGIGWMSCRELSKAIPPAFTEYLGEQIKAQL